MSISRAYAWVCLTVALCGHAARADIVCTFEDRPLPPNSFYNGSDLAGGFNSGGSFFNNDYSVAWSAWQGWSVSNLTDTTTPGYGNQYSAYAGGGYGGGGNYGVAFSFFPGDAYINLAGAPVSARITNTTYAALTMRDGDLQTNGPFGGIDGNRPDWFKVVFTGYDAFGGANGVGNAVGSVEFFLADYRFLDNTQDYIVDDWRLVDFSSLSGALSLSIEFQSSDVGTFGMNTPAYLALDNLITIPEPSAAILTFVAALALSTVKVLRRRRATIAGALNDIVN